MGGWAPLGYEVRDRKLIIHDADAERVGSIFRRFVQLKSATLLARELVAAGATNRYGHLLDKGVLYGLLNNRVYLGEAVHKGTSSPRRTRSNYRPGALGQGTCHSQREPPQAGCQNAGTDAGIAEGPSVRTGWRSHVPNPHPEKRAALSVLHQPERNEARQQDLSSHQAGPPR